ncbi:hypothetical protein YC2023_085112 [Brassica napus]
MVSFFYVLSSFFFLCIHVSSLISSNYTIDTISGNATLSGVQSLVSSNGIFEMGMDLNSSSAHEAVLLDDGNLVLSLQSPLERVDSVLVKWSLEPSEKHIRFTQLYSFFSNATESYFTYSTYNISRLFY